MQTPERIVPLVVILGVGARLRQSRIIQTPLAIAGELKRLAPPAAERPKKEKFSKRLDERILEARRTRGGKRKR